MARGGSTDDSGGEAARKPSLWMRFQNAVVQPDELADTKAAKAAEEKLSVEELQGEIATMSDKERAIGLIAAPVAAALGLIVSSASIDYAKTHHQGITVYDELTYVMLGMS